ncbi:MAG TPA: UvrD-helicase domain-containing protein [Anaeromyxobacteraceae bacterium]|jgi:DNA helicase-2/ATP-dependent DNA helicase PcrA|nr:UvrD-helicase domain-containing protein [Anaeromyxobacteraceae bacterium]
MLDLSTLNPPQREAVTTTEGPLLVLAGAGSGKTRVIAHRVAHLIERGVDPERILAVTFTNKASGEMRERVTQLAGPPGADVFVSTFHSFGLWLLKEEHKAAGLPRRFAILDASDQLASLKRCMREVKVDDRSFDPQRVLALISKAKNALRKQPQAKAAGGDDYDLVAAEVFPRYELALKAQRAVDFDDLISRPVRLLRGDEAVLRKYQDHFQYLLVDEYQDTNRCQLELLKLLAGERMNVCAVGDDDQAIYGWRGAEVRNILRFERHFPGAREVRLEQNYRSTGRILACANGVIGKNASRKEKKLWTAAGEGAPVQLAALQTDEEEAQFVAAEISRRRAEGRAWHHCAVLYRLNAQSRPVEEALREQNIPYRVHGGPAFFDRAEVRDLLAYLKVCVNPADEISLARVVNVPARGIGDASLEKVHDWALQHRVHLFDALERAGEVEGLPRGAAERMGAFVGLVKRFQAAFATGAIAEPSRRLVAEVDLYSHARGTVQSPEAGARKVDAIDGVLRSLESFENRAKRPRLSTYLNRLALDSREEEGGGADGVTLMTLHAAKGLEFPVVFLIGMEEDLLPSAGIQGEARDLDEERRLAYVGITRAREELCLSRAAARLKRGKLLPRTPSRFLEDLPSGAFALYDPSSGSRSPETAARSSEVLASLRARLTAARG